MSNLRFRTSLKRETPAPPELLERIARTPPDRLSEAEAREYCCHPDELVAVLVTRLFGLAGGHSNRAHDRFGEMDLLEELARRAAQEAKEEGVEWTPLLDAVVDVGVRNFQVGRIVELDDRVKRIHAWVRSVHDPAELEMLAAFNSGAIRHVQYEIARTIPERLLSHWVRNGSDAVRVLRNRALAARHATALAAHVLTLDRRAVRDARHDLAALPSRAFAALSEEACEDLVARAMAGGHADGLAALLPKLPRVTNTTLERLATWEWRTPALVAEATLHRNASAELQIRLARGEFGFPEAVLRHRAVPAQVLRAAWHAMGKRIGRILLEQPRVPSDIAIAVVRSDDDWYTGRIPASVLRPEVALAAMESLDAGEDTAFVAAAFVQHVGTGRTAGHMLEPFALASAIKRILDHTSRLDEDIVEALASRIKHGPLTLPVKLVKSLLTQDNAAVREFVIANLSRFEEPTGVHDAALRAYQIRLDQFSDLEVADRDARQRQARQNGSRRPGTGRRGSARR